MKKFLNLLLIMFVFSFVGIYLGCDNDYITDEYITITFVDYDNTILYQTEIIKGGSVEYKGLEPIRESKDGKYYEFSKWSYDLSQSSFYIDTTIKAEYLEQIYEFTVKFIDYDDSVIYETKVIYGETAIYNGYTPSKPTEIIDDYKYTYTFIGWNESLDNIRENKIFFPIFEEKKEYIGENKNENNSYVSKHAEIVGDMISVIINNGSYQDGFYNYYYNPVYSGNYVYLCLFEYDAKYGDLYLCYSSMSIDQTQASCVKILIPQYETKYYDFYYTYASNSVSNEGRGQLYAPTFNSSSKIYFSSYNGDWGESVSAYYCALMIHQALDKFASYSIYDLVALGFNNYDY